MPRNWYMIALFYYQIHSFQISSYNQLISSQEKPFKWPFSQTRKDISWPWKELKAKLLTPGQPLRRHGKCQMIVTDGLAQKYSTCEKGIFCENIVSSIRPNWQKNFDSGIYVLWNGVVLYICRIPQNINGPQGWIHITISTQILIKLQFQNLD